MNGGPYDDAYCQQVQLRLRSLLALTEDRLSHQDRRLLDELIDANESGVALEMIADRVAADSEPPDESVVREMISLARTMGLSREVGSRLRPLSVV